MNRSTGPRQLRWPWRSGADIEREVAEELAFHLDMRAQELEAAGLSAADARSRARSELGDVDALHRSLRTRDERAEQRIRWRIWLSDLKQDLRFGARSLMRSPGFTAAALTTLALGIGASVAIFTVVNAVVLRPLPYPEPDRLVRVWPDQTFNIALADAVLAGLPSIEAGTGISEWSLTLTGDGEAIELRAQFVDADFFRVFGVRPQRGRVFGPEERDPTLSGVVVISHALWQSRFGGDSDVVGRMIDLDGFGHSRREVIGILPPEFIPLAAPGESVDVWLPLSVAPGRTIATDSMWYVSAVVGRLAPGATVERASAEVSAVVSRIRAETGPIGNLISDESVRMARAASLHDTVVGDVRGALLMLLAAVGLILLLVCANLTNLLLARGDRRQQELAVRSSLGAGRGRLVRSLLTESVLLAGLGGIAGVLVARALLAALRIPESSGLPRGDALVMDTSVLGFAFAVSAMSVLGFGLLPALRSSRGRLREHVGSGGRAVGPARRGSRLGFTLIAAETALAMVLVTGAALLLSSLRALRAVDTGLDTSDVLAIEVAPPAVRYGSARATAYYQQVGERLATLPGVHTAGAINLLPFAVGNWRFPYLADGHPPPVNAPLPSANFRLVLPGYFDAVDQSLDAGRYLDAPDGTGERVGLINRALAELLWPGESALDRTIRLFGNQPFRVVGVVGDVRQSGPELPAQPEIYFPLSTQWAWTPSSMVFMLETTVPPASLAAAARDVVRGLDPDVPIRTARPLDEVLGDSMQRRRFFAGVLTSFGVLALGLGAVGVYGVMAYSVSGRIREFGVRLALGATSGAVVRRALFSGLVPVGIGLAVGVAGSLAVMRAIEGLLFGVSPRDPVTLTLAALVLGAIATLAIWIPARRAGRIGPAEALRGE